MPLQNRKIVSNYFSLKYFIYTSVKNEYKKKRRKSMTKTIIFVQQSVKDFVANTAMSGGDKTKVDTKEEYSKLKDLLSNNKDLPKNEKHYVTNFVKEYEKNVAQAVILEAKTSTLSETKALTAKDVKKKMLNNAKAVLEQEEGIKISKGKIRKYIFHPPPFPDRRGKVISYTM